MILTRSTNGNYYQNLKGNETFFVLNAGLKDQSIIFRKADLEWSQLKTVTSIVAHNAVNQFGRKLIRTPDEILYLNNKLVNCVASNTSFVVEAIQKDIPKPPEGFSIRQTQLIDTFEGIEFNLDRLLSKLNHKKSNTAPEVDIFLGSPSNYNLAIEKSYDLKNIFKIVFGDDNNLEKTMKAFANQKKTLINLKVLNPDYVRKTISEGEGLARISSVYSDSKTVTINLAHLNYCNENATAIGQFK